MLWTFVCTEMFTIIRDKSNMERMNCICIFTENKFRLPPWSLLITISNKTGNNTYTSVPIRNNHRPHSIILKNVLSLPQYQAYHTGALRERHHPLSISFWTLYRAGWCHSVLPFNICTLLLLIITASFTCLVRQSLVLAVTFAL